MIKSAKTTIPADFQCVKCGSCLATCPVYLATGRESHSPRGKLHLIENLPPRQRTKLFAETISLCLLCGACKSKCPRGADTPGAMISGRAALSSFSGRSFLKYLGRKALTGKTLLKCLTAAGESTAGLLATLPEESGLRLRLAPFAPGTITLPEHAFLAGPTSETTVSEAASAELAYFTGCLANNLFPDIARATAELTHRATGAPLYTPAGQQCCGLPAMAAGNIDEARQRAKANINAFADTDAPVLTSCASCSSQLKNLPRLFTDNPVWHEKATALSGRVVEFFSFFAKLFTEKKLRFRDTGKEQHLFYHDPCHLRFDHPVIKEPRRLIAMIPGVRLKELPDGPRCCGQGGLFHLDHPSISRKIRQPLVDEVKSLDINVVLTSCSGCLLQWRDIAISRGLDIRVLHPAEFLLDHLDLSTDSYDPIDTA